MRDRNFSVMPAQAGIQVDRRIGFWIPAFAGMTALCLETAPLPQDNEKQQRRNKNWENILKALAWQARLPW
jgi:hypothetical protein